MRRLLLSAVVAVAALSTANAQIRLGDGQLSGSFETNTIGYINDKALLDQTPDDHFGSNNYLKADYTYGRFSVGLQADAYLPALQGYDVGKTFSGMPESMQDPRKFYISSKYIQWQDKNYGILVGDIFDQFGNGLILRTFEDRQLGFNNSLEGIRASYDFGGYVQVKGLYGRPRVYTYYADSWVRGADLSVSLSNIIGWNDGLIQIEGSYVNRYDKNNDFVQYDGLTPNLDMFSGRLNFGYKGFSFRGEYVNKSKDLTTVGFEKGKAVLAEVGYGIKGFSMSGTFRMIDNMTVASMLSGTGQGAGNIINYLPTLTRQYTYLLANLEPYQLNSAGELAGQVDLYYSLRSKTSRQKYWNFHVNFSTAYTLAVDRMTDKRKRMWMDVNFDVERQWNKSWKTSLLYSFQENEHYDSRFHIFVGDVSYKIDRKKSLRFEVQYLYTNDYQGDWVAGVFEFNLAPSWSFFVQDMYNLQATAANNFKKVNYYNGGVSYTHSRTRVQLSFGRNRAGYICSGGVCRYSPAYTGVNLAMTTSF